MCSVQAGVEGGEEYGGGGGVEVRPGPGQQVQPERREGGHQESPDQEETGHGGQQEGGRPLARRARHHQQGQGGCRLLI